MDNQSIPIKRCSCCKDRLPLSAAFSKCKSTKDGYLNYCKRCAKLKHDEWARNNRDHLVQYNKSRRENNPDLFLAYSRARADRTAYRQRWEQHNHDKTAASARRRRAKQYNAIGTHTAMDITILYINQRGKCAYCSCPLHKYHVDHVIPLSRGGSNDFDNLTLACPTCNLSKGDKLLSEWNGRPSPC